MNFVKNLTLTRLEPDIHSDIINSFWDSEEDHPIFLTDLEFQCNDGIISAHRNILEKVNNTIKMIECDFQKSSIIHTIHIL